ncbi:hypothetical protein [Nostoc sp. CMAA1605]|uniref:hypothetical protein n=1 Tax=Nostoc sp. CMAA1605 TaxID=2055159 RepID=UPI001F3201C2|nr:hypothetical protein [Nostoc sp. CMAA1605]
MHKPQLKTPSDRASGIAYYPDLAAMTIRLSARVGIGDWGLGTGDWGLGTK